MGEACEGKIEVYGPSTVDHYGKLAQRRESLITKAKIWSTEVTG